MPCLLVEVLLATPKDAAETLRFPGRLAMRMRGRVLDRGSAGVQGRHWMTWSSALRRKPPD